MLIDLHIHEKRNSPDSHQKLEDIVQIAKKVGLDAIAITDHDSMGIKEFADSYSKKVNFPIFTGIEYFSLQGDIIAFGIDDYPRERVSAQEFVNYVHECGGVTFACHPFRCNNRGLEKNLLTIENLTGVEVLNGNSTEKENFIANKYCNDLGFKPIGVSDSHSLDRVGVHATKLEDYAYTMKDLVELLKFSKTEAVDLSQLAYR